MASVPHLDDHKHSRRGVIGTIVEGDDGGAMSSEQVAHLTNTQRYDSAMKNVLWRF